MKRNVLHEHTERGLLALVDGGHVHHEVHHAVGVAPLVVVPGHHLHVVRVEHDAGVSVEDARLGLGFEVGGHQVLYREFQSSQKDAQVVEWTQRDAYP